MTTMISESSVRVPNNTWRSIVTGPRYIRTMASLSRLLDAFQYGIPLEALAVSSESSILACVGSSCVLIRSRWPSIHVRQWTSDSSGRRRIRREPRTSPHYMMLYSAGTREGFWKKKPL
ncbi:hypothetical protein M404DRAFT_620260 [Pisolithus tinctorius Marx 270]|uniref:Uncharacterized protein n=1 Tax=Pisolithus tinctorius Marx 270 TaxID=870435 RepID=A0A0C3P7N6_PISTI|nr:hypothetical protein M404DRAFT_620260 [Pisolithus tinctorius Marx 270]